MDVTYVNHVVGQSVIKMQYTTNYNLKKPESGDDVTPTPFNDNADTVDTQLKNLNDAVTTLNGKVKNITISTADPSGGSNGDIWIKYE